MVPELHKKVLGIIVDENLDFNLHIQERKNKCFKALKCIEHFINNNSGCSQSIFVRLYKSLVLPTMDECGSTRPWVKSIGLSQLGAGQVGLVPY